MYAIAVAIPVSFATAERSFSALKRVKARIHSSMSQERLEALLLMVIERKVLKPLDLNTAHPKYLSTIINYIDLFLFNNVDLQ